jgi:hypothetical protein
MLGACYCRNSKLKGSVCTFVHNSLKFTSLNIDSYCLDQDSEVCAIHLNSVYNKLCVLAIYKSPLCNFNTFLTNFDLILHKLFNLKFNLIICGYININYLAESYKKNQLDNILQSFNPLPLLFKSLLPGQEDCVFFSGHFNLHAKPETIPYSRATIRPHFSGH